MCVCFVTLLCLFTARAFVCELVKFERARLCVCLICGARALFFVCEVGVRAVFCFVKL